MSSITAREHINLAMRRARDTADHVTNQTAMFGESAPAADVLAAIVSIDTELDHARRHAVASLRASGASWTTIGNALAVSRQAAQQRYGRS